MGTPDLKALQCGDPAGWDEAFRWLWPTAFEVARFKLQKVLPGEVEDVALEALEELVEKVKQLKKVEELKPLTASIAHNRAVSRLRQHFSAKRGSGQTESLDAHHGNPDFIESTAADSPVAKLEQKELSDFLSKLLAEIKPPLGKILADFFLDGLSYDEIAKRHGLATGSIGVYLKRGLEAIRRSCPPDRKSL